MSKPSKLLKAIETVLLETDRPLCAAEIAHLAFVKGLISQLSSDPDSSINQAIRRHIQKEGNELGIVSSVQDRTKFYRLNGNRTVSILQY